MNLRVYVIIGYLVSIFLIILGLFWAANRMLIVQQETYFLIGITLVASLVGASVSLLLLAPVFSSLRSLKKQAHQIANKDFSPVQPVQGPLEFQELAAAFNEMAADLETSFASLAESEREKGLMIAQLSHDIKTPITSIQATVEGILDGVISKEEEVQFLQTISRQTERLDKLVEELNDLTLSSAKKTTGPIEQETIFLDQLLINCMSEFQLLIEQEHRDIHIRVEPESAHIKSNYAVLSRIIVNLINNAFKYSASGTKLEVSALLNEKEGKLRIAVTDEGQGIAKEELERIFKRLYRVESSRNMATGGHGLGLAIAKELAHQLGGTIEVTSQLGVGSTFTLVLAIG